MIELEKPFRKNPIQIKTAVKIKVKLPHVNKNAVFPLYFDNEFKKRMPQNHSLFRSTSCFGVTKITSIFTSKIMKICEHTNIKNLKKDSAQIRK